MEGGLTFRPIEVRDLEAVHRWWNDPRVMKWVRAERLRPTLDQIRDEYWPRWCSPGPGDFHMYILESEGRPVGEIGWRWLDADGGVATVDIKIGEPDLWGRGLGTGVVRRFVAQVFIDAAVDRIVVDVGDWNARSLGMFRRCGFTGTGRSEIPADDAFEGGTAVRLEKIRGA